MGDAVSDALRDECAAEFAAGIGTPPWRLEAMARRMLSAANAAREPPRGAANDLVGSMAWTFADRLAKAFDVTVLERPRGALGQYGGAIVRRRACWVVEGLDAPIREVLQTHEVVHVASARDALTEGAVWWITTTLLYPSTLDEIPRSLPELYLGGAMRFPGWCAERRWSCLEILAAAHDEAV